MFNQLPQILSITLQVASSNFNIVQNSKTIVIKEKKFQDLSFQSLSKFQRMIKDLLKRKQDLSFLMVFPYKKKTSNGITCLQS